VKRSTATTRSRAPLICVPTSSWWTCACPRVPAPARSRAFGPRSPIPPCSYW